MGARSAASRALAWASLPLLGLPAGALCEDTLYCRGKAGPQPARPSLFPGTCWRLFLLPHPGSVAEGPKEGERRHRNPSRAWGEESGALCKLIFGSKKVLVSPPRLRSLCLPLASVFLSGLWDSKIVQL